MYLLSLEGGTGEMPLGIVRSQIRNNWAESNLIHILLSRMVI